MSTPKDIAVIRINSISFSNWIPFMNIKMCLPSTWKGTMMNALQHLCFKVPIHVHFCLPLLLGGPLSEDKINFTQTVVKQANSTVSPLILEVKPWQHGMLPRWRKIFQKVKYYIHYHSNHCVFSKIYFLMDSWKWCHKHSHLKCLITGD